MAKCTVPSIFSSKSVFFVCRWMPGLQPIPNSPSTRAPSSVSSVVEQEVLVRARARLDDAAALEAEHDVLDRAARVAGRILGEGDDALGRVLDRAVEDLAAGHVRADRVDAARSARRG